MLDRVLEPEVMDSAEEARDYDSMDHAHVNQLFISDLLAFHPSSTRVLDVGTGTAQIPIELCRRHPKVHVIAIDMAQHMLDVGRRNVERAGFADRIELRLCDAKQMPFGDASFDCIMSNSIVHHIPAPLAVFAEMARVIQPGGTLFVRDLLRPSDLDSLQRFVQMYAGDANAHQQKMFGDSLHAALTLAEVRAMASQVGFNPATVQQTSDRHWTWAARKSER
ncbi:MAG TPA: methyltransferase domain-containing protein [Gemmataceae bacterium]|nr:methyltransferase domain-containing protein [Gemmataceae bacterium]